MKRAPHIMHMLKNTFSTTSCQKPDGLLDGSHGKRLGNIQNWIVRYFLFFSISSFPNQGIAFDFSNINADQWYHVIPNYNFQSHNEPGARYENRHWCNLRYNPDNQTLMFFGGFSSPSVGNSCIYANALYEYFPETDEIQLRSLSNWFCNTGNGGSTTPENFYPIPEMPATPKPRHTYSQFAYGASGIYLLHGSMGSDQHLHDFWRYDMDLNFWDQLGSNEEVNAPGVPPTNVNAGWANIFDNNLIYHSPSQNLYFFHLSAVYGGNSRAIYTFDTQNNTWNTLTGVSAMPSNVGGHGCHDTLRDRFVFFGSAYAGSSSDLYVFNPLTKVWTILSNPGGVPWPSGRNNAGLQYNSVEDVYMLLGSDGQRDLWIFNPSSGYWSDLTPPSLPSSWPPSGNEDSAYNLAYHKDLNILVRYDERDGSMWLYRHGTGSSIQRPHQPGRLRRIEGNLP